jgi:hypothetical protein
MNYRLCLMAMDFYDYGIFESYLGLTMHRYCTVRYYHIEEHDTRKYNNEFMIVCLP